MTTSELIADVEETQTVIVDKRDFQRWAAAVGDLNPLYFDEDFAREHGHPAVVMPPLFLGHLMSTYPRPGELLPDGTRCERVANFPLPERIVLPARRMAGGDERWYFAPIHHGDVITAQRRLVKLEEKQGRSGSFVLLTWESVERNQTGTVVAKSSFTMVAR